LAHSLLEERQAADPLSPADAALASELVLGVLRHRLTCEHLAARFYRGRWESLRPGVRMALALGVYQICWLGRVPVHAAVDQSVRLARRFGHGAGEVVNALLRRVADCRGEAVAGPAAEAPRRRVAIDGGLCRSFSEDVFPDPARRPLEYLVAATSHPMWLVERWHRRYKPAKCGQICAAGGRRPGLSLRANLLRTTADQLLERLRAAGRAAAPVPGTDAIVLGDGTAAADLAEFHEGLCQPQDATAQAVVEAADPRPGEVLVDLCAGVGTKSTQAAERMGNEGRVIAADIDTEKLGRLEENARRLGISIIGAVPAEAVKDALRETGREPDIVLVDAPCTNTGVLARRPEARYRASQRSLLSLVSLQEALLRQAADLAGPATRIAYSTCSLEEEENEEQVAAFVNGQPGWRVERQALTLPEADRDGGYFAVLRRS
jgi:16S rRNA (cytosine967-C5)-methyltransferase